jgi:hypothetical protein
MAGEEHRIDEHLHGHEALAHDQRGGEYEQFTAAAGRGGGVARGKRRGGGFERQNRFGSFHAHLASNRVPAFGHALCPRMTRPLACGFGRDAIVLV